MAKNIIEKIWEQHVVYSREGYPDIFAIDLHLMHEVTSPQAFDELRSRGLELHAKHRCIATVDHNVPTSKTRQIITDPSANKQVNALRKNVVDFGVKFLDMDSGKQGIVHVIGPELGLTQPGMTIVCGDSHTSTHGAFGAIAFGIGTTEIGHVMATGCMLQKRPKTMKVSFDGRLQEGVGAKDLVLKLIQKIGIGGGSGYILEYCGEAVKSLSMEERMTICNMSIECGARAGLFAPDEITFEYMKGRPCAPNSDDWQRALKYWKSLSSDADCKYDAEIHIDASALSPVVTWGINPSQSVEIDRAVPLLKDMSRSEADAGKKAFDYTGIAEGQSMIGVPVDFVFIGSCTNARLSDLKQAAEIIKGRKVADGVKVYVVPGSEQVRDAAEADGTADIFRAAGADFREPGCSMCLGMNEDKVPAGKRCASTSNRNFVGRQGKGSITHLMSPIMAAAAAVEGKIVDIRNFKK